MEFSVNTLLCKSTLSYLLLHRGYCICWDTSELKRCSQIKLSSLHFNLIPENLLKTLYKKDWDIFELETHLHLFYLSIYNLSHHSHRREVENFIKANTQELAKDKWLCPLSGKKFRGPEFVRKHIMMKHGESVDNVRTEVDIVHR